jgi:hypothetical protein
VLDMVVVGIGEVGVAAGEGATMAHSEFRDSEIVVVSVKFWYVAQQLPLQTWVYGPTIPLPCTMQHDGSRHGLKTQNDDIVAPLQVGGTPVQEAWQAEKSLIESEEQDCLTRVSVVT